MTTLFFLLVIPFLLFEINTLINTKKAYGFRKTVATKEAFADGEAGDKAAGCLYLTFAMIYFIWGVLGVALSTQWLSFSILIGLGLISALINKALLAIGKPDGVLKMLSLKLDAIVSIILLVDIFLVHFRSDVYTSILMLFK
jgi:hypothetical protein